MVICKYHISGIELPTLSHLYIICKDLSKAMLWIEDKCREKEVDFTKDVIYMYYRDLVK